MQVYLPFAVDAAAATAELSPAGSGVLTIRLPYQPYTAALQQSVQPPVIAAQ